MIITESFDRVQLKLLYVYAGKRTHYPKPDVSVAAGIKVLHFIAKVSSYTTYHCTRLALRANVCTL
jgi:hypothetical protein